MQHAESLMAAEPAILRDAFGQDETTNANPFQDQSRFPHRTAHIAEECFIEGTSSTANEGSQLVHSSSQQLEHPLAILC